jgi:hypothetical protein
MRILYKSPYVLRRRTADSIASALLREEYEKAVRVET